MKSGIRWGISVSISSGEDSLRPVESAKPDMVNAIERN